MHTRSEDLRVFPGIHRFTTNTHVHAHMIRGSASVSRDTQVRYRHTYTHTWSQDLRVFLEIHRFVTYTHIHAHMITGSASVSRDTQVRYLHTYTCTHDHRICECFQGYTGSLLTHTYTHTWSQDLRVFLEIHRFVTYTHIHAHMITGSASVSQDTQVRYLHTCICTHDHRICECFQGYTGSLLTHMYMHTWSQDLRVFPGIHRFITNTHVHAHMITGSVSVSRDTQVHYLHTCTRTHDQRICECFQGYTGSLLTHMYTHTWSQDLRLFPGIHRFITNTHVYKHMIRGSVSVSRDTQVRY